MAEGQAGEVDRLQDLGDAQQYNINVDHGARAQRLCVSLPLAFMFLHIDACMRAATFVTDRLRALTIKALAKAHGALA